MKPELNEVRNALETLSKKVYDMPESIKKEILLIKLSEIVYILDSYPIDTW